MTNLFDPGDALGPGKVVQVRDHHAGEKLGRDAVIDIECDIWIPAARPDVVREDNVGRLRTKLVLQGANIPYSLGAEQALHDRGVLVVPDAAGGHASRWRAG